jgi:uncharacterized protein (DUF2141 family)
LKKNHWFVNILANFVTAFGWFGAIALALPWLYGTGWAQPAPNRDASLESCRQGGVIINLTVDNVGSDNGFITVDVHAGTPPWGNPADFLKKGKKLSRIRVPAQKTKTAVCIAVEAPGLYALAVYHDEDGNRKFNKNFLGIPNEPFGVSNNPTIGLGPPSFEEAAFNVPAEGTSLNIDLGD